MANLVVFSLIIIIVGLAITKIVAEKRKGNKCIGCPLSGGKDKAKAKGCGC